MSKIFTGGAIIPYGENLPAASNIPDGSLFYNNGSDPGLWMLGYIKDNNAVSFGPQVAQDWIRLSYSATSFVLKGGDVMQGSLEIPGFLRVTQTAGTQRILIGNQDSGGIGRPGIIEASNGQVRIGYGSTWAGNGGTTTIGLSVNAASITGLTFLNQQVWHAQNDGASSGLDADLLDGQQGAFYQNGSNINAGAVPTQYGGTGSNLGTATPGSVLYVSTPSTFVPTAVGTAGSLLVSGGAGAPAWTNPASITVGNATNANSATSATNAGTAAVAESANRVVWGGVGVSSVGADSLPTSSKLYANVPITGFSAVARPSMFYIMPQGLQSMVPGNFQSNSISGFDAYNATDMNPAQVGLTVVGNSAQSAYAFQLSANWNFEELSPSELRFRVNDDTGNVAAWGAWTTIWNNKNLTNVSQLTNDAGYVGSAALNGYVAKTGDSMTGSLTMPNAGTQILMNGITITGNGASAHINNAGTYASSGSIQSASSILATGNMLAQAGVYAGTADGGSGVGGNGYIGIVPGGASGTGYVSFMSPTGVRQGFIQMQSPFTALDGGNLGYYAGLHSFNANIQTAGNVTAYASDARLKKNIVPIKAALQKVLSLGGYTYDWDMDICEPLGFKPANIHEHGLIAQEVEAVMPDAVAPAPFNGEYKTVRYERIVALLTAAIGEQQTQINALQKQIELLLRKLG